MKRSVASKTVLALALAMAVPAAAEMNPRFEPLRPLLGKTWKGVFPGSTAAKPVVDVSRFELALNGQAIRVLHSINAGDYGGESLIVWDKAKDSLVFYYFTTAGFYTTGTLTGRGRRVRRPRAGDRRRGRHHGGQVHEPGPARTAAFTWCRST